MVCILCFRISSQPYGVLEREVRANLVYRDFTRVGGAKMPDAKTMGRWGLAVEPEAIKQIHERMVKIAQVCVPKIRFGIDAGDGRRKLTA